MNADSRLRIREVKRRRSRRADLSGLELMAVPGELFELVFLHVLDLSGNCLSRVDERLSSLIELRELDLSSNLLETLPRYLGQLPHLEKLALARNPLKPELFFLVDQTDFTVHRQHFLSLFENSDEHFRRELGPAPLAPAQRQDRVPTELQVGLDQLQIGPQLAQGGFAVVHRAQFFGADVAVKVFVGGRAAAAEADFLSELHALAVLRHPAVVSLLGFGAKPDRFLVLELVEGPSLHAALHLRRGQLDKISLLRSLAAALTFLHTRRLVHRDLTPRNVLLTAQGRVKLIDFGLCRPPNQLDAQRTITTPAYAAPELFGPGSLSEKVDVWSFGVLLWEVATERVPAAGLEAGDIRRLLLAGQFAAQLNCSTLSSAATALVHRCLQNDPLERPSMAQVCKELAALDSL